MRELVVRQKILAAGLFCLMPASESLQHDSMQDLVTRSFLLLLWWKELTCLGVLIFLALLVTARVALRTNALQRAANDPIPTNIEDF